MSGGGGSGTSETWTPEEQIECGALVFRSIVSSPQMDVVKSLAVRDILSVRLETIEDVSIIGVMTMSDALVGSITGGPIGDLLRCLQQGVEYIAEVMELEGSVVRVEVRQR